MAELSTTTAASIYNQIYHLQKPDYSRDVTEASQKAYVFVLLTSSQGTNTESRVLIEIWRELAQRFGDVKFCQMRAELCIEGYPDKNTPTVLVYKDGDIKRQIVTLKELGGVRTSTQGTLQSLNAAKHGLEHAASTTSCCNGYSLTLRERHADFTCRSGETPSGARSGQVERPTSAEEKG